LLNGKPIRRKGARITRRKNKKALGMEREGMEDDVDREPRSGQETKGESDCDDGERFKIGTHGFVWVWVGIDRRIKCALVPILCFPARPLRGGRIGGTRGRLDQTA